MGFYIQEIFKDRSQAILKIIRREFKINHKKLFKKEHNITFVGIHNRRSDHLEFQKEGGFVPLEVGYFLEAMEMFRTKYSMVVFMYVSGDIQWGREEILKRVKTNDFCISDSLHDVVMAENPEVAGIIISL